MRMTPAQIHALSKRHQWNSYFADRRCAIIAATVANVNRDPKRRSKAYRPEDFMPKYNLLEKSNEEAQTPEQMQSVFEAVATIMNERAKKHG